jgi:hypothetical protein
MKRQSLLSRYRPLTLALTLALTIAALVTPPATADDGILIEGGRVCENQCWNWARATVNDPWVCYDKQNCCVENGQFAGCTAGWQ